MNKQKTVARLAREKRISLDLTRKGSCFMWKVIVKGMENTIVGISYMEDEAYESMYDALVFWKVIM